MKEVSVFIASSVREFERERLEISPYLEMLNGVYKRLGVQVKWNRPEIEFGALTMGGSQTTLDGYVKECDLFALIVGARIGEHTEHEFQIALGRFRETKGKEPIILPCFLKPALTPDSAAFLTRIRTLDIGAQYIDPYANFEAVLTRLLMVLTNHVVNVMDMGVGDEEADFNRARERMIMKIRALCANAKRLEAGEQSRETVAELATTYAQIARLVREYKVAPDALWGYMSFLQKQHQYDMGIELGHWMEGYYTMESPSDYKWSMLKNGLGLCYVNNNQYAQAERCFLEELEINRRLAADTPAYEADVAVTCNNLAMLLMDTNRMEEAERYCGEALEIYRRLAKANSGTYELYVAATCNNLAILLKNTNRMEEAERYYREALEIKRQLAKATPDAYDPDVAMTCNNLAILLMDTNRMEEAEQYYVEALEIRRRLAKANPDAYEPDVAATCNNLANLLKDTNRMEEAERYCREALEIYRRLVKANPDAYEPYVAGTCYNLARLIYSTNRIEEAENYIGKALEIRRRLAKANPKAYEPDVAMTCYNLWLFEFARELTTEKRGIFGLFKRKSPHREAARRYFEEALSLWEKFPHLAKYAQMCREWLAKL